MVVRVWSGPFCYGAALAVGEEGAVGGDVGDYFVDWEGGVWEGFAGLEGLVGWGGGGEGIEGWEWVGKEGAALGVGDVGMW